MHILTDSGGAILSIKIFKESRFGFMDQTWIKLPWTRTSCNYIWDLKRLNVHNKTFVISFYYSMTQIPCRIVARWISKSSHLSMIWQTGLSSNKIYDHFIFVCYFSSLNLKYINWNNIAQVTQARRYLLIRISNKFRLKFLKNVIHAIIKWVCCLPGLKYIDFNRIQAILDIPLFTLLILHIFSS